MKEIQNHIIYKALVIFIVMPLNGYLIAKHGPLAIILIFIHLGAFCNWFDK